MSSLSERRAGLYLHWGDSGGGTLGRSYSKTEAGAIKNGVKNPVYVPEGTTFKIVLPKYQAYQSNEAIEGAKAL